MPTRATLDRRIAATGKRITQADQAITTAVEKLREARAAKAAAERELAAWQAMPASDENTQSDQDSTPEGTE